MKKEVNIDKIVKILDDYYPPHIMDVNYEGQPYKVLVSCLLSLRTRDEITFPVSAKLFAVADTPEKMANLPQDKLENLIKSINYYKTKAQNIIDFSKIIVEKHDNQVPETIEELLKFKGVGRKTANLVVSLGHLKPAICVDTHVHKIANRLGYIETKNPEQTEYALRDKLPVEYWRVLNQLLVLHGREICKTINPKCSVCPIIEYCNQVITNNQNRSKK